MNLGAHKKFVARVVAATKKYHLDLSWQDLKFDFRRAVIACDTEEEFQTALHLASRIPNTDVDFWTCYEGCFEGYVYLMERSEKDELQRLIQEEVKRAEAWWRRYHAADSNTRRRMACGEID